MADDLRTSYDSHVVEPVCALAGNVASRWLHAAPIIVKDAEGREAFMIPGLPRVLPASEIFGDATTRFRDGPPAAYSLQHRLAGMRERAVSAEWVYPTLGLFLGWHPDPAFRKAFALAYNRWLAESWQHPSVHPVGLVGDWTDAGHVTEVLGVFSGRRVAGVLPLGAEDGPRGLSGMLNLVRVLEGSGLSICFHAFSRRRARATTTDDEAAATLGLVAAAGAQQQLPRIFMAEFGQAWTRTSVATDDLRRLFHVLTVVDASAAPNDGTVDVRWGDDYPHGVDR